MRTAMGIGVCLLAITTLRPPAAEACGGLFCGQPQPLQQQQPVDQRAERILFRVNDNSVTMVVQIAYTGSAQDFAWVLPLGQVPDKKSLKVFPQRGLNALDANTSMRFIMPACFAPPGLPQAVPGVAASAPTAGAGGSAAAPPVTVHFEEEVGPYDVAAVESEDPMALYTWLLDNGYNVNETMLPYIRIYTSEGMKFLALKLQRGKDTTDIEPLRFDLPGTTPSIPLRMTSIAAEPEMSILVFVAADRRYDAANWPQVEIENDEISWRINFGRLQTNWEALLARSIDAAGGQGWVTEFAGPAKPIVDMWTFSMFGTAEETEDIEQLLDLIETAPYITRLHTRLSAEEMTLDPVFKRVTSVDVSNTRQLVREVDGVDQCGMAMQGDPCAFTSCGAGGLCRPVMIAGRLQPACACLEGSSARTTIAPPAGTPMGTQGVADEPSVACQDLRMSFANPGDMVNGVAAGDPCLNFDCGAKGSCVAVNMTPTCVCDRGFVAVGGLESDGTRTTGCVKPMVEVPANFYNQRLPDLPQDLPGGRTMAVDSKRPVVKPRLSDLSSRAVPAVVAVPVTAAMPVGGGGAGALQPTAQKSGGCSVGGRSHGAAGAGSLYAMCVLLWWHTRRRAQRAA